MWLEFRFGWYSFRWKQLNGRPPAPSVCAVFHSADRRMAAKLKRLSMALFTYAEPHGIDRPSWATCSSISSNSTVFSAGKKRFKGKRQKQLSLILQEFNSRLLKRQRVSDQPAQFRLNLRPWIPAQCIVGDRRLIRTCFTGNWPRWIELATQSPYNAFDRNGVM